MTHRSDTLSLPTNIFCCDYCTEVDTRNSDKPYHDPNRHFHQAIYQSFLNFATRLSAAKDLELVQAREAEEIQRQLQAAKTYAGIISAQEESDDASISLMDMIRSYDLDHRTTHQNLPPSLVSTKSHTPSSSSFSSAFTLPSSPPFTPSHTPHRPIIAQKCSGFQSFTNNALFRSPLISPPASNPSSKVRSNQTSVSSGVGQSFMEFLRNGITALPSSDVPNLGSSITDSKLPEWGTRATTQVIQPLAKSFTPLGTSGLGKSSKPPWSFRPTQSSAPAGIFGPFQSSTATEMLEPFQSSGLMRKFGPSQCSTSPEKFADISFDDFRTVQAPYWTETAPEPFIPQRVLSPSNLINNPLITNPPPTYVIHITSRQDYGKTESHRYFVCPTDLASDWPEVSLLQWFAAGVGYNVKAEKWDHKCLQHQKFFRMVLRPNLAMREWGLGKPLEELQTELAKLNATTAAKFI
ncbi:hypothetical protein DSL72_009228 [Monilinia vaccinii-corymbosi]|uniref:Uncharacterized protein n=1 Tax=Monilinia vaccinii-corymbosi TaxID=61207 RepID=A0A8A3PQH9_9HELO|nr:hypothetical protein DSL72_009228 [Monilinia vaccinii-corymbosi]